MIEHLDFNVKEAFSFYPSKEQVDCWAEQLLRESRKQEIVGSFTDDNPIEHKFGNGPNALINKYIRFDSSTGHTFYGYWQPALKQPAPLLINLPGYGGYMSMHPQINDDGYNILHISPLGYVSPQGIRNELLMEDGNWPVLSNTARGFSGDYRDWFLDCLMAINWAKRLPEVLPEHISLFGTSQGGGGSLVLASILQKEVCCVCADIPFLTAFPLSGLEGDAYGILQKAYSEVPTEQFWSRLGYIDTISHAHRLNVPVMLSAGGADVVCPPVTVEALFGKLHTTKQYTYLEQNVHTHSRQSMILFRAWLALYA